MRREILLSILIIAFISGCIQGIMTPEDIAKNSADVKAFLNEYPHATVIATLFSNISINEECDNPQLPIKDYYKVTVKDPDTNMTLIAYIDSDSQKTVCAIKTGGAISSQTKATIYCKDNESLCQEILTNCTDSILIEEEQPGIDMVTFNITKEGQICNFLYYVNKFNITELENTSMICNYPIVNGKTIINGNANITEYCKGSFLDKLSTLPSGGTAPTARCTGNIMIRTPWSVSTGGTLIVDLENRVGQTISVTNIFTTVGTQQLAACQPAGLANLASGNHNATTCTTGTAITGASTGSTYSAIVAIEYNISTGQKFNSSCTISGTYSGAQQGNIQFRIESTKGVTGAGGWVTVSIRNIGTTNINGSSSTTGFYTDGNLVTAAFNSMSCTGCSGTCNTVNNIACTILPSAVATYNLTPASAITCGTSVIKVTNGAAIDSRTISC